MSIIIKRELKNYLKNPIFYIGAVIIFIGIYSCLSSYLKLHYFESDEEIKSIKVENISDADIMDGYIPTSQTEKVELGLEKIKQTMIDGWEMSEREADAIIQDVKLNNETIPQMCKYLEEKYQYYYNNAFYAFEESSTRQGSAEEVNAYMQDKFKEHDYSWYFAKKYADFGGLYVIFFATILLAFLFIRDMKADTYELLHTKPISATQYILGKILGGFLAIMLVTTVITTIFTMICIFHGKAVGFPVSSTDLWKAVFIYFIPNILMVVCVYAGVALLFKNPLPAIPLLLLYIIYSNMGSVGVDGMYGYYGRILAILVRFPGGLLETSTPPMILLNQTFLILAASILVIISSVFWKRRRTY